jgi:hypothetical protein
VVSGTLQRPGGRVTTSCPPRSVDHFRQMTSAFWHNGSTHPIPSQRPMAAKAPTPSYVCPLPLSFAWSETGPRWPDGRLDPHRPAGAVHPTRTYDVRFAELSTRSKSLTVASAFDVRCAELSRSSGHPSARNACPLGLGHVPRLNNEHTHTCSSCVACTSTTN